MRLAAMMGLMIEEMRKHLADRCHHRIARGGAIDQIVAQARWRKIVDERDDPLIQRAARRRQRRKIRMQNLIEPGDVGAATSIEPAHPDRIADQDVIKRLQQRGEEPAARAASAAGDSLPAAS